MIEIVAVAADVLGAVEHERAADHAPAWEEDAASGQVGLRLGVEVPVVAARLEQPGGEHRQAVQRISAGAAGLEKQHLTGNISYDPENHERMVKLRAEKIAKIADHIPPTTVEGDADGELLIIGWGSTHGAIASGVKQVRRRGHRVGHVQLRHLNPLPKDLGDIMKRFRRVVVAELNLGQLCGIIRGRYLVDAEPVNKVQGLNSEVCGSNDANTICALPTRWSNGT